jgi:hypothetical protein
MTAELATRHDGAQLAPVPDYTPGVASLVEWADAARAAHAIAESLVKTSFVPKQFRDKPHEATAAILSGTEVGLSPMAALRSFDIIDGTAAARAATLRAVVQSRGHDIWVVESTEHRCVMEGQRAGSSRVQRSVWTIDRAQKLGVTNKDNWRKQPTAMLVARATSEIARMVASDAILGIPYSVEELRDGVADVVSVENEANEAQVPRTARRRAVKPAPPQIPEPSLDESAEPEPLRSEEQHRMLFALLSDNQLARDEMRPQRLAWMSDVLGREVTTSKSLTVSEASRLIDALDPQPPSDEPPLDGAS